MENFEHRREGHADNNDPEQQPLLSPKARTPLPKLQLLMACVLRAAGPIAFVPRRLVIGPWGLKFTVTGYRRYSLT